MNAHRYVDENPEPGAAARPEMPGRLPEPGGARLPAKSPVLAGVLSLMPGLGQVYVGFYQRGFVHLLVVGATIAVLSNNARGMEPLLGIFLAFFWLYNVIDAVRLATLYNLAVQSRRSTLELDGVKLPGRGGSLAGGILLVIAGFLLLLNTKFAVSMEWLEEWWPIGVIGLGIWLAVQSRRQRG